MTIINILKKKYVQTFLVIAVLGISALANAVFIVGETESAIVLQFGEALYAVNKGGIYLKLPFLHSIKKYDNRYRLVLLSEKEVTCADNKRIVVNALAYLKIRDPIKFFSSVNNYKIADIRVRNSLESCMREVIGQFSLVSLLSSQRNLIMQQVAESLSDASIKYGLQVKDFRISKADLPAENAESIHGRMKTAREQEAKKIRAEGAAELTKIYAQTNKEKQVLLAEAYKKSQEIKAQGNLKAAQIYNKCYAQDAEFFKFLRSLEAYKKIFEDGQTNFIISISSEFFKHLNLKK